MSDNDKVEQILDEIVNSLKKKNLSYSAPSKDGRVNSALNEDQIVNELKKIFATNNFFIKNNLQIKAPNIRDWYDFAIGSLVDSEFFIPVNIKVSVLNTDNLNCKLGIYYALTGLVPSNLSNEAGWDKFFRILHTNINTKTDKDYYFLVANKNDNKDYFWNSLKQLTSLIPNGNNLPFQANWAQNREKTHRTHDQAGAFILDVFKKSIYKRTSIRDSFDTYMDQHLKEYNLRK